MNARIKIECPKCKWQADGGEHWTCSCGHSWNTFDTKGKCPACGKQWQDTYCPVCRQPSPHEDWYTVKIGDEVDEDGSIPADKIWLLGRKEIIENKLNSYGINGKITYLPYLEFFEEDFQPPHEVGCRILVLWAVSYLSYNLEERGRIEAWLKDSGLWDKVSEDEKRIFTEELSEELRARFSWRIEAVIVLCWTVNLLCDLPALDSGPTDDEVDNLMSKLPIEDNPDDFLSNLAYRDKEEIFIENIINEMITWDLRDKMLKGRKETLKIDPAVSCERHYALNWVRKFSGIDDWDETDTST